MPAAERFEAIKRVAHDVPGALIQAVGSPLRFGRALSTFPGVRWLTRRHRRPSRREARGRLVFAGPGPLPDAVTLKIIHLAGGRDRQALGIRFGPKDAAGRDPGYYFKRFGVRDVQTWNIHSAAAAEDPAWMSRVLQADMILCAGPEPADRTEALRLRSLITAALRTGLAISYEEGAVLAATGWLAGHLAAGDDFPKPLRGLATGLAVLPHSGPDVAGEELLDALGEVVQRGGRIAAGLAPGAAVVISGGDQVEVIGEGRVLIVEGRPRAWTDQRNGRRNGRDAAVLIDTVVHLLPPSYRFDLAVRRPIPPQADGKD